MAVDVLNKGELEALELRVVQVVAVFVENCLEVVKRGEVGGLVLGAQVAEHLVHGGLDAIELLVDLRHRHCGGDRDGVKGQTGPYWFELSLGRGAVGKDRRAGEEPVLCLLERCPGGKHRLVQLLAGL